MKTLAQQLSRERGVKMGVLRGWYICIDRQFWKKKFRICSALTSYKCAWKKNFQNNKIQKYKNTTSHAAREAFRRAVPFHINLHPGVEVALSEVCSSLNQCSCFWIFVFILFQANLSLAPIMLVYLKYLFLNPYIMLTYSFLPLMGLFFSFRFFNHGLETQNLIVTNKQQ